LGLTGRYDFKGIQKLVTTGVNAILMTTSWGAWLLASPFKIVIQALEDAAVNWLANHGLILLNIGAIMVDGSIDQSKLDTALQAAITKIQGGRDKLTPAEGAEIDQEVSDAFDQDADIGATNATDSGVPDVPSASLRGGNHPSL
jgi:hypothetical protein